MYINHSKRQGCLIISSLLTKLNSKTHSPYHSHSLFRTVTTKQPNSSSFEANNLHHLTRSQNAADKRSKSILKPTVIKQDTEFTRASTNIFFECQDSLDLFKASFEPFVQDLLHYSILNVDNSFSLTPQQAKRVKSVFDYNLTNGKNLRSYLFLECYKQLRGKALKREELDYIHKIGWIFETIFRFIRFCKYSANENHSFFCLMDDIMDGGETRHGHPCWYRLPEVGYQRAIVDGLMLEHGYFLLLQNYMAEKPYCLNVLRLFHETNYQTSSGQLLDMLTANNREFTEYNMELYTHIVTKKTGYYTFFSPIATSLLMNGIQDRDLMASVKKMSLNLSMLYQIQDDFLDCFGDLRKSGKAGTDIQEGKCSWLVVKALESASTTQKNTLINNVGSSDENKVAKVKELYIELGIPTLYADYEALQYDKILAQIQLMPSFMPKRIFEKVVQRLCKRSF